MRRSTSFLSASAVLWIVLASSPFDARAQGADTDGDLIPDAIDNCTLAANGPNQSSNQVDTDGDGTGNRCDPDFNNDCIVNDRDLELFQTAFASGTNPPLYDLDGNGLVSAGDFNIFASYVGSPPGPPGCEAPEFPADESARVALFVIDSENGDLVSASPALDAEGPPPADRSESVGEFTIDANNGDLVDAPANVPDSGGAIDRSADVDLTVVDAENGELLEAPANVADSGGAIDRSADVAETDVDTHDGDLLSGPATSTNTPVADDHSGMVRITQVDSTNGVLVRGAVRYSVPEPVAPTALLAAGLVLIGRWRGSRAPRRELPTQSGVGT